MKMRSKTAIKNAFAYGLVAGAFVVLQLLSGAGVLSSSLKGMLVPICAYVVMALSLNLTVGVLGELSLGHAGFMSVGAFTGVTAAVMMEGAVSPDWLRLLLAMLVGAVFAAIAGVLIGIPVLRLRGDYLAIVTLAFGEIIRSVLNCLYISVDGRALHIALGSPSIPGKLVVNGPAGAVGVAKISTFVMGFALVMLTLVVVLNLINSRSGRAIMAIRDSRIAAESVGIHVTKYKMMAFVISAALAGMAGALFGLNYSTVAASKFKFDTSILVLVFVVLGGIGNIRGSVIAAALLTILPELLRAFSDYRMLVYAIVLILVMLLTNNPQLAGIRERLTPKKRPAADPAKGGDRS